MYKWARHLIPTTRSACTRFHVKRVLQVFCLLIIQLLFLQILSGKHTLNGTVSCVSKIYMSLPTDGNEVLEPGMFLAGNYPDYSQFEVDIMGPLKDSVDCDQLGQLLMVVVTDTISGNSCMAELLLEDKIDPQITSCEDIVISCYEDIDTFPIAFFITAEDNCTDLHKLDITYSQVKHKMPCDSPIIKLFERKWYVKDLYGNMDSCSQTIRVERMDFDVLDVEFPEDTTLSCPIGNPDTLDVGIPMINGMILDPALCEIVVFKSDNTTGYKCGGQSKITRIWTVMDWCNGESLADTQKIIFIDTIPPVLTCRTDTLILQAGSIDCYAKWTILEPIVSDECAEESELILDVLIDSLPLYDIGDNVELGFGLHKISYTAKDPCGNADTCHWYIMVEDNTGPNIECSDRVEIVIPVQNTTPKTIPVELLNLNIMDNCSIVEIGIRKFANTCDEPQDTIFGSSFTVCCNDALDSLALQVMAIDTFGNADTCTFYVDIQDKQLPEISCITDTIDIYLDDDGIVVVDTSGLLDSFSDECIGIDKVFLPDSVLDCNSIGMTDSLEIVSIDLDGNEAGCYVYFNVMDTIPPSMECMDITIDLDVGKDIIYFDSIDIGIISSDNCFLDSLESSIPFVSCNDLAFRQNVLITLYDQSLNSDTCTINVFTSLKVECLPDTIVDCTEFSLDSLFKYGKPIVADACNSGFDIMNDSIVIMGASSDTVIRSFVIIDLGSNLPVDTCTQIIEVIGGIDCNNNLFNFVVDLGGKVFTEAGIPLQAVNLLGTGNGLIQTSSDKEGSYRFEKTDLSQSFTILPSKHDEWLNGISVADMVIMQKHILGIQEIESPYAMVAADLDRSGHISISDLLIMQKLLLGTITNIENNSVWRFVDASYDMQRSLSVDPLYLPEAITIRPQYQNSMKNNFIGIKVGDLNYDVRTGNKSLQTRTTTELAMSDVLLPANEEIKVELPLLSNGMKSIQLYLALEEGVVVLDSRAINTSDNSDILTTYDKAINRLSILAYNLSHEDNAKLEITLRSERTLSLSDVLTVNPYDVTLGYLGGGEDVQIQLRFEEGLSSGVQVSGFTPNPFTEYSTVSIYTDQEMPVDVHVISTDGRLLRSDHIIYQKGENQYILDKEEISFPGLYYVQFVIAGEMITRKVIITK